MKLPKYTIGQQVVASGSGDTWMFQINSSQYRHGQWRYNEFTEDTITHVLNGGYWVPAEMWNGPVTPDMSIDMSLYDAMTQPDPDEEKWLDENVRGKELENRGNPRKIEVKDAEEK
jgi:hypothetical protein